MALAIPSHRKIALAPNKGVPVTIIIGNVRFTRTRAAGVPVTYGGSPVYDDGINFYVRH